MIANRLGRLPRLMTFPFFRRVLGATMCATAWRRLGARIHPTAFIGSGVMMRFPERVTVGAGSRLGIVEIDAWAPVTIGANVLIASANLFTGSHYIDHADFLGFAEPITVGDYAWIIHQVIVLPGVTIGRGAIVGTGAVVTRNVDALSVVAGNPAREIKKRPAVDFEYIPSGL